MNSKDKKKSIDKERNREDLINDILLSLKEDGETVAVLVEGADDVEFFQKVFQDFEHIAYFESLSGCEELAGLLNEPELNSPRVIAVRDRDYTNPDEYPPRMFAYDCCAMELMILWNPQAQEFLKQCYTRDRKNFPLDMMRHIAPFSLLRKKSALNDWEISFQKRDSQGRGGISVLAGANPAPNLENVFRLYESSYPEQLQGQYEECGAEAAALSENDLWYMTNGHDICRALGAVSELAKNKALGESAYRRLMIMTYDLEKFKGANLYFQLSEYRLPNGKRPFAAT